MARLLERTIEAATAVASIIGAGEITRLLTDPAKQQLAIDRLTREVLLPDPREEMPRDLMTAGKLQPAYQIIPFEFRNLELDDYLSWCGGANKSLLVRLITGDSGRGKTRLMVELAGKLRDTGPMRTGDTRPCWVSGFVRLDALQKAKNNGAGNPYDVPFASRHDLCLIVDYAENKPDEVTRLLKAAVAAMDDGRNGRIRIILIARQHTEVFATILQDGALANRGSAQIHSSVLRPVADPQAFFQTACNALDVPKPARVYPEGLKSEEPDCGLLSLAALLAAARGTAITEGAEQILDMVLVHEKRYWENTARRYGVPDILLAQRAHEIVSANLTMYGLQGAIPDIDAGVDLIANIPLLASDADDASVPYLWP